MASSITVDIKKLERYVMNLPKAKKLNTLNRLEREAMLDLRDNVSSARENIVKYTTADDTAEKLECLSASIEQTKLLNDSLLIASQYDLLDVVDVAHLSAMTETIKERLQ